MMSSGVIDLHRQIEVGIEVEPVAVDDALRQALFQLLRAALLLGLLDGAIFEQRHECLQRVVAVGAAVEDQVLGDPHLVFRDAVQRQDLREMHDRAGQPALQRMVEEHRVQHLPRRRVEAERDVGEAEDDLALGHPLAHRGDRVEGVEAELAVVRVAGADRKGQRVEQQVARRQAVPVAGEIVKPLGDAQFVVGLLRHALFVDRQGDDRGAEALRQFQPLVGRLLAVLEIDRVDDRLAAVELERGFQHRVLGRVHDQGRVDRAPHAADDLVHLGDLVTADKGGADIEGVRAFLDLLAPHLDAAVPVAGFLQAAEGARAVGVAALADRQIGVFLAQRHLAVERGDRRGPHRAAQFRHRARRRSRPMRRSIWSSAAMCPASVPQQPPIKPTPSSSTKRSSHCASSFGPSG